MNTEQAAKCRVNHHSLAPLRCAMATEADREGRRGDALDFRLEAAKDLEGIGLVIRVCKVCRETDIIDADKNVEGIYLCRPECRRTWRIYCNTEFY